MGTIAKGEITLSPVNDAYTVSITPASCTIAADFDGSNPKLDNAKGVITVKRGTKSVPFHVTTPHISTGGSVKYLIGSNVTVPFYIESIPANVLEGTVSFDIATDDGFDYKTTVSFAFTIVRETTMLDWIQDWEGGKTKIGDSYIMTPKIFIGKKEDVCRVVEQETPDSYEEVTEWIYETLTGVYIGPDLLNSQKNGVGIYGYLQGEEIFHLNADGGLIGGWTFNEAGLQSSNGIVNILSEGSIFAQNPDATTEYWGIYADGHATFAKGNVKFMADGSAEYAGKITSKSGQIGGWSISADQLYNTRIILDTKEGYIGINASKLQALEYVTGNLIFPDVPEGGVKMWYNAANDFGFAGWSNSKRVFSLGSVNMIAGWNFNHQALWTGSSAPYLSQGSFATNSDELTIAPNGIRSQKWYVDANGTAQFVGGSVKFNTENAEMFGWKMRTGRFSAAHAALTSSSYWSGLFVSPADLTEVNVNSLTNIISNSGGIYMYSDGANSILRAYDTKGKLGFALQTNGYHTIGNWNFNHEAIYTGSQIPDDATKFMSKADQMVLSTSIGLVGYKWRLSADGSGSIAGGHISWNANGDITLDNSVKIAWTNVTGTDGVMTTATYIDANGIFTGKIDASKITTGTLSASRIDADELLSVEGKWALKRDGSGYLSSKNIQWNTEGTLWVNKGYIGGWELSSGRLGAAAIVGTDDDGYPQVSTDGVMGMSLYNDFICFNHSDGRQAIFGTWSNYGYPMLVRLINNRATQYDLSSKIGIYFDIANSIFDENYAFCGRGNGVLNGVIDGYAFTKVTMSQENTVYGGYMNTAVANRFLVKATANKTYLALPTVGQLRRLLNVASGKPFCARLTIISDIGSKDWTLIGRTSMSVNVDGESKTPYNNANYPVIVHYNGSHWTDRPLGAGDSYEFMIVYDPDQTETLNGWSTKYTARVINIQS